MDCKVNVKQSKSRPRAGKSRILKAPASPCRSPWRSVNRKEMSKKGQDRWSQVCGARSAGLGHSALVQPDMTGPGRYCMTGCSALHDRDYGAGMPGAKRTNTEQRAVLAQPGRPANKAGVALPPEPLQQVFLVQEPSPDPRPPSRSATEIRGGQRLRLPGSVGVLQRLRAPKLNMIRSRNLPLPESRVLSCDPLTKEGRSACWLIGKATIVPADKGDLQWGASVPSEPKRPRYLTIRRPNPGRRRWS